MATAWVRRRPHSESSGVSSFSRFRSCIRPSPDCAFHLISGDCGATCSCIASFNSLENYAPDDSCVIKLAFLVTLDDVLTSWFAAFVRYSRKVRRTPYAVRRVASEPTAPQEDS